MAHDYVTKKELTEALGEHSNKIVEDLTEVITAGFGLAATKRDLQAANTQLAEIKEAMATKDDIADLEHKLVEDTGAITKTEYGHHQSVAQRLAHLEKQVFPKNP
jgi:hypothetical protein